MATITNSVFTGNLNTTEGTRTARFTEGDYILILAPTLQQQGLDLNLDCFLQLIFSDNTQRLIPLNPVNVLDTSYITFIPEAFKSGNDKEMYLYLVSEYNYLIEVLVVTNTDENLETIKELTQQIKEDTAYLRTFSNANLLLNTADIVVDSVQLGIDLLPLLAPLTPVPLPNVPLLPLP